MKKKTTYIILGTIVLSGLLLTACKGASQQVDVDPHVDTEPQQQGVEEGVPEGNIEVSEEEIAPTPMLPEPSPADVKPTPRPELSASDPAVVNLASGGPQIVEFFAFW